MTKSNKPNRLINETSPYLLQHAYNPVDWFPWGNEAFAKAKTEDKPVFLSIGYSTCHWCHVMEEESFEDIQVAEYLNAHFVSVKVDKEERPDVDAVYMTVCQALTGSGGWPTTILMTHEQKPFFAGTYFPKHSRWGHTGLLELLDAVKQKWDTERKDLLESCDKISQALNDNRITRKSETVADRHVVEKAINTLTKSFDKQYGGFGRAPKFPMPHNLMFLLRCHLLGISDDALPMTKKTLEAMYRGGIFDHIGGGFSRYSTDNKWLAPHFEKMLYDNALMTIALTECYTLTKNEFYGAIVKKVLAYVTNEMTSKEGGFFSAQDADIGGEEGKYYTFTSDEIIKTLGDENAKYLCGLYDITENGNFEGKNILNLIAQDTATLPDAKTQDMLDVLYEYRKLRYRLHTDDKILTSWNALMIAAFARAGRVFGCEKYIDTAINALNFLYENLADGNGRIFISYRSGKAKGEGLLDDYAFLAWACLELYDAAFEVSYLEKACNLAAIILNDFSDAQGGFYLSPVNGERLLLRTKEQYDGATPSGNSVAAYVLTRLAALTAQRKWLDAAERQLRFYGDMFEIQPTACVFALLALVRKVYPAHELVCVLSRESDIWPLSKQIHEFVPPQTEIIIKTPENSERLAKLAPFTNEYAVPDGKRCAFYLCSGGTCRTPVYEIQELTNIFSL